LHLLGSGSYATSESSKDLTYSIPKVLDRLAPFSSFLVSESIILDARQGRHKEALQLLTHGLGDYDTAVRYCYFGGPTAASSQPIDASLLPPRETQRDLFSHLLAEFLLIEDVTERMERSSELLGKFAAWFDPLTVFTHLPESWTVDLIGEFLLHTLRAVMSESNEAVILKALSAAQNLQSQATFVEACEKFGIKVEVGGE
jgi:vacuolar protein sorting-associated protein 3